MHPMDISPWIGNWAWSLPLIVVTVVIHACGLALIGGKFVAVLGESLGESVNGPGFMPKFAVVIGGTALLATLLHGIVSDDERPATPLYAKFANAVRVAKAEARATAEVTIKKIDPKWWLARMHRDLPDAPGWMPTNAKQESPPPPTFVITRYSDQPSEKDGR